MTARLKSSCDSWFRIIREKASGRVIKGYAMMGMWLITSAFIGFTRSWDYLFGERSSEEFLPE